MRRNVNCCTILYFSVSSFLCFALYSFVLSCDDFLFHFCTLYLLLHPTVPTNCRAWVCLPLHQTGSNYTSPLLLHSIYPTDGRDRRPRLSASNKLKLRFSLLSSTKLDNYPHSLLTQVPKDPRVGPFGIPALREGKELVSSHK